MRIRALYVILVLILFAGCARAPVRPELKTGLSEKTVIELWGPPVFRTLLGRTARHKYPVEVWEYTDKKDEVVYSLIFVDGELFSWAGNDPEFVLRELAALEVIREKPLFDNDQYQQQLRTMTEEAERTRRTLDTLRAIENNNIIQRQQQQQNLLQIQRNLNPPPPARPQGPIRR